VLTATSRSYGKAKNSTPHRIETPNLIEIKFGTVDFMQIRPWGASLQMGKIYAQNFYCLSNAMHMHWTEYTRKPS